MARLIYALLLILSGTALWFVSERMTHREKMRVVDVGLPPFASMDRRMAELIFLGHKGAYDDFLSIWAIQYLNDKDFIATVDPEKLFKVMSKVAELDLKVESFYLLSCFVFAFELKKPEKCESFAIHGLKAKPNAWKLAMTQGFVAGFLTKEPLKAAGFYKIASEAPYAPDYVRRVAHRFANTAVYDQEQYESAMEIFNEIGASGQKMAHFVKERLDLKTHEPKDSKEHQAPFVPPLASPYQGVKP
jgi:hypothetical protein